MNEFDFIEKLVSNLPIESPNVLIDFGDDCACVKLGNENLLFTIDSQIEGVHFLKDKINPKDLGWKLVSVNVSDIVACGGIPKWGLISVCIAKNEFSKKFAEGLYLGLKEALDFYQFSIIGGNTSSSSHLGFDLALVGTTKRFVSRSGARIGDKVYISGYTGLSRAGLELLLMNKETYENWEIELIKSHVRPKARIDFQPTIEKFATSCIDISDGLVADINHIAKASKKKVVLFKEKLPLHPTLGKYCKVYDKNPLDYILYGGEDYELIFTTDKNMENAFLVGKVEEGEGVFLDDKPIEVHGFSHL